MNHDATIRGSLKSQIVKVICTEYCAGEGTQESPMRTVLVWHTLEGSFIGRRDSGYSEHEECKQEYNEREDMFGSILETELIKQRQKSADLVRLFVDLVPTDISTVKTWLDTIAKDIEANKNATI